VQNSPECVPQQLLLLCSPLQCSELGRHGAQTRKTPCRNMVEEGRGAPPRWGGLPGGTASDHLLLLLLDVVSSWAVNDGDLLPNVTCRNVEMG
jgi:hypothetical protein